MSDLIDSVGVVLSYFVDWLSSLTTYLISNPIIQLVFASSIFFLISRFIISLIISIFDKRAKKKEEDYYEERYFDPLYGEDNYNLDMSEYDDRYNV